MLPRRSFIIDAIACGSRLKATEHPTLFLGRLPSSPNARAYAANQGRPVGGKPWRFQLVGCDHRIHRPHARMRKSAGKTETVSQSLQ